MVRMPKSRLLLHWEELLELRLIHYQISMYFFRLMGMATLWWSWSQYTLSEASEDIVTQICQRPARYFGFLPMAALPKANLSVR
jgi:hypothetical protein